MSKRRDLKALFLTTFVALSPPAWINATPASGGNPQEANHLRQDGRAMLRGVGSPLAATAADQGRMQRDRRLTNLTLRLKRSPEQREALDLFIAQQQNPRSPNRKRWLTPEQVGDLYGPSKNDVAKAVNWLSSQGFQVDRIANARNSIKFSGSVDAIEHAFGTQVHSFRVGEDSFPAIVGDASVPSDLQDVVSGVVLAIPIAQLNVRAKTPSSSNGTSAPATIEIRPEMTFPDGTGDQFLIVTPQDFATIYNVRPAWSGGLTGQGQTIAIPSSTNVRADDWLNFRRLFGLPSVPLTTIHPSCANPGFNANWMAEASLDVQWAGAAAPGATIQLASCPDGTNVTGAITALENLIDSSTSPPIIAWSYGTCEATLDPQSRDWIRDMFQQAAAQGTSVFVAAGDQGPGFCEPYAAWMKNGIDINAWAATPYAVAVGATDFSEVYSGTQAQYWDLSRRSTSSNFYQSALSYVPEMTWNSSCASPQVYEKFNPFQGRTKFCNSAWNVGRAYAGGGGASRFEPKPLWQAGILGNPNDQKRGIPDVSLFGATSDWWKHAIVYCVSNPLSVSSTCNYDGNNIMAAGGTSFSAPAFAGIQALINQKLGSRQGNLNYALYQIGRLVYNGGGGGAGFGSLTSCNANNGAQSGSDCVFHDVTLGETTLPCFENTPNCMKDGSAGSGQYGLISASSNSVVPTWAAGPGWDFATGLGSVNVSNLINAVATVDSYVNASYVPGDVNGDRFADIVLFNSGAGGVGRWLMKGTEIQHSLFTAAPTGLTARGFGDINGDGSADIVWTDAGGNVTLWYAEGEGQFISSPLGPGPSGSTYFGSADFNGDGFGDLVFQSSTGNVVTIWLMMGSSTIQTITRALSPGSQIIAVGDFDHDGLADLAVRSSSAAVSILRTLPDTSYVTLPIGQVPVGSQALGAADMNGDSSSDLVFFNSGTRALTTWLLNGATVTVAPPLTLPHQYYVASIADLDGTLRSKLVVTSSDHDLLVYGLNEAGAWTTSTIGDGDRQLFGPSWSILPVQSAP